MTKGEQNLRAVATQFAVAHGLEAQIVWTRTGLQVEFRAPLERGKNRRFMRCTLTPIEVERCGRDTMDLLKVQWTEAWMGKGEA